ncbi:MAG: UvrD-helicase domain-containing protein [Fidelibacterota bacterium]|nr:MAG: UvrD-helicase domain-containing protein [Candidatus Neomarinimicrobiota bacterium]
MMNLDDLNPVQAEAVQCVGSPVLIFAGAGSGKTRVLAYKIAYLIEEKGLEPEHILAVTFTNKAANEMRNRVDGLLHQPAGSGRKAAPRSRAALPGGSSGVHVGTFHSVCARILRQEIHRLGYRRDFVIYDTDDQLRLLKLILERNDFDLDLYPPQAIQARISWAKNRMQSPSQMAESATGIEAEILTSIYEEYQQSLKENNALDFDDLLLLPLTIFEKHPRVLGGYRRQFQYILVDEYQDTNRAQFEFVRMLAEKHRQICAVGDDDQSIYTWRGADITNILNFTSVFADAKVFKLEQNYRSTSVILKAAGTVVARNQSRASKTLWTEREGGDLIQVTPAYDERDEAEHIYHLIQHEVLDEKRRFKDMVILYRTNAQSRALEDALRRRTMAYVIVGGTKFYDRKEVKDVLAYLRLLVNPLDAISLERIINFPPRAIGETSMNRLRAFAREKNMALFEALDHGQEAGVQSKQAQAMKDFKALIERYQALTTPPVTNKEKGKALSSEYTGGDQLDQDSRLGIEELVTTLLEEVGIGQYYRRQDTLDSRERLENINELIKSIEEFREDREGATLRDFLEEIALLTDIDRWNDDTNAVTLMTLHSAKGLEFPVVFMTGLEEGLFPLLRSNGDSADDEEERRLFYVGLTRAKDKVYLSYAAQRRRWGTGEMNGVMSRFIRELPEDLVIWEDRQAASDAVDGEPQRTRQAASVRSARRKAPAVQSVLDDYVVGAWVEHKIFGKGQITEREGVGDNLKLTVTFSGGKQKKLVARYANLHRL